MARKHENFDWSGYKYAPESVRFFLNGKRLSLPEEVHSEAAYLAVCGKNKEVEDILKRALRKDEKQPLVIGKCIAFFEKDTDTFYYAKEAMYKPGNLNDALYTYKAFKHYITSRDCMLNIGYQVSAGEISPLGKSKVEESPVEINIDLSRSLIINVVREAVA